MTGRDCMDFNTKEILDIEKEMSIIILDKEGRYKNDYQRGNHKT